MDTSAQVLGATYFGPVEGSPLIPPELITIYFLVFLGLLVGVYFYLLKKKQPVLIAHKIKLLVLAALAIKVFFVLGGSLLTAYWLVPAPNILETTPKVEENNFAISHKLEVIFDRPVDRSELTKSITPETPGFWVFENSIYTTHLYRKLVFVPTQSLKPDTKYEIKLSNIKNMLNISKPFDYSYTFKTQPAPKVESVNPVSGSTDIKIDQSIVVNLTNTNENISQIDFELNPQHPFETKLDLDKKSYTLSPKDPFKQGTKYQLVIKKTDLTYNLPSNTVIEQSPTETIYDGTFTTKEAPGIKQFSPQGESVLLNSPISLTFSQDMDRKSVEENFVIEPNITGQFSWQNDQTVTFKPAKLEYDTNYKVTFKKGTKANDAGFLEEDIVKNFNTIGRVKVSSFNPTDGWKTASIDSPIKVNFNQPVNKSSAESKFAISPKVEGTFSWEGNSLVFDPKEKLSFSTKYTVTMDNGVKTINGLDSNMEFTATFTTQEQTTKLAVPAYLQKYSLSCEIASLRMALAFKGVQLSEDTILGQVGLDPTPHQGDIWGNPHQAFVGNVRGKQMADGYGVHWEPIARVAALYKGATAFQNWGITQLTEALAAGNPVVIWVYSGGGWPTTWRTPDGQTIAAARDEHAVTAVGFVGPTSNPSQIIINDPLVGQVYWNRALFDKKWAIFKNAGVVVF